MRRTIYNSGGIFGTHCCSFKYSFFFTFDKSVLLLIYLVTFLGAKCLMEMCNWANPVSKEKPARLKREQLKQHMLSAHSESIPTA